MTLPPFPVLYPLSFARSDSKEIAPIQVFKRKTPYTDPRDWLNLVSTHYSGVSSPPVLWPPHGNSAWGRVPQHCQPFQLRWWLLPCSKIWGIWWRERTDAGLGQEWQAPPLSPVLHLLIFLSLSYPSLLQQLVNDRNQINWLWCNEAPVQHNHSITTKGMNCIYL